MQKITNNFIALAIILTGMSFGGCGEDRSQMRGGDINTLGDYKKPWIYELPQGDAMVENNFIYIPGGFDVDGDDKNEGGFWLARYEAKKSDRDANISSIDNIQAFIVDSFKAYNKTTGQFDQNLSEEYLNVPASEISGLEAKKVDFNSTGTIYSGVSALEAAISLSDSQIENGYMIGLPSEKQWMQVVQLVINNPKNWTEGEVGQGKLFQGSSTKDFVIANNLLGNDEFVPADYERNVTNLAGSVAEWTRGAVYINDRFIAEEFLGEAEYSMVDHAPLWWKPILKDQTTPLTSTKGVGKYHNGSSLDGANNTLEIKSDGTVGDIDQYSVVARGGSYSIDDQDLVGISAAKLSYGLGYKGPTVGFRAASKYVHDIYQ